MIQTTHKTRLETPFIDLCRAAFLGSSSTIPVVIMTEAEEKYSSIEITNFTQFSFWSVVKDIQIIFSMNVTLTLFLVYF